MNFTWWINRKDPEGRNLFQGGFLGLDNIGVFDRSAALPGGGTLEQADGTAWMALYSQAMLQMALELTKHDAAYSEMAVKFAMHLVWIGAAMSPPDGEALWSEEDGFYYDVMRLPDGSTRQLKVRSLVGCCRCARRRSSIPRSLELNPELLVRWRAFVDDYEDSIPSLAQRAGPSESGKILTSLVGIDRLRRILAILLDESEFLSPYGVRAISRFHAEHPYVFDIGGQEFRVDYEPAESRTGDVRRQLELARTGVVPDEPGDHPRAPAAPRATTATRLKVECPTGSGNELNLLEVADEIGRRLAATFLRDERRPAPRVRGHRAVPVRSALARPAAVLRVLPRRQRRRPRREPPDRLDRTRRAAPRAGGGRPAPPAEPRRIAGSCVAPAPRRRRSHALPPRPTIYEINTAVWLGDLGRRAGPSRRACDGAARGVGPARCAARGCRLADGRLAAQSGRARRSRSGNAGLVASFRATLPDLRPDDVIGSPYCVRAYELEPRFGDPTALAVARTSSPSAVSD